MGTSSPAPWKQLLLCSIQSNSHLKHYSYFQLATVSSDSRPSNRTVVFRGFQDDSDKILINTDTRSRKQREKSWFACSLKSRVQYTAPAPRISIHEPPSQTTFFSLVPSAGPVDAFCLLVLDPDQVDYLNLKTNVRLVFTSIRGRFDGDKLWTSDNVNP